MCARFGDSERCDACEHDSIRTQEHQTAEVVEQVEADYFPINIILVTQKTMQLRVRIKRKMGNKFQHSNQRKNTHYAGTNCKENNDFS